MIWYFIITTNMSLCIILNWLLNLNTILKMFPYSNVSFYSSVVGNTVIKRFLRKKSFYLVQNTLVFNKNLVFSSGLCLPNQNHENVFEFKLILF